MPCLCPCGSKQEGASEFCGWGNTACKVMHPKVDRKSYFHPLSSQFPKVEESSTRLRMENKSVLMLPVMLPSQVLKETRWRGGLRSVKGGPGTRASAKAEPARAHPCFSSPGEGFAKRSLVLVPLKGRDWPYPKAWVPCTRGWQREIVPKPCLCQ